MFDPVRQAELLPSDVSKLLGVNRITVSMWLRNHCKPHRLLGDRVEKLVDAVRRALDSGALPVPRDVSRRERGLYIRGALEAGGWRQEVSSS
jgi:hypothetical protein